MPALRSERTEPSRPVGSVARSVFTLELTGWYRDRRLLLMLIAVVVSLIVITAWATASDIAQREAEHAAAQTARAQWEGRGAANPHGMAHFGDFAFRPAGPLARLDRGVQARLGKVLFMEGHRQGVPLHADADRAGPLARFARLDAAFLLQFIVPLMLIFLGSTGLAADRRSGRLKLAIVQGASGRQILTGHLLALWSLALALLLVVTASSMATAALFGESVIPSPERLAVLMLGYAAFFGVIAAGIVAATVWFRSARTALLALLVMWVAATALLPRAAASVASTLHPLPSQDAFEADMRESREAGPDGHNPEDVELERLRQEALDRHGSETVEELPFNFDGIAMQVDEEFGNQVWDEHFGDLRATMQRQNDVVSVFAFLNPFQAVDHLSMAIAGTDLAHDLAFQQQAEDHRRALVEALNLEHAYGGSRTGDWSWEADPEFFASLPAFEYRPLDIGATLQSRVPETIGLGLWLMLLLIAVRRGSDRIERGTLPC